MPLKLLGFATTGVYAGKYGMPVSGPDFPLSRRLMMMRSLNSALFIALLSLCVQNRALLAADHGQGNSDQDSDSPTVEFFQAMKDGQVDAKFIAKSDHDARVLVTNKTGKPLTVQMPAAFAGVPALAQIGGGGFGGGGRGGGGLGGGGGGQQSVGGGMGGGGGMMGGGGGMFSIPPDKTAKINVAVVCLDHGLRDPSSSTPYKIVPAAQHIDRPAVIELLKAFGEGKLNHQAAQAATWHLNNDMSWQQLATKLQGTRRSPSRPPYFSRQQIQMGMAYASKAMQLADLNAEQYQAERAALMKPAESQNIDSDSRSTSDPDAVEPESSTKDDDEAVEAPAQSGDETADAA